MMDVVLPSVSSTAHGEGEHQIEIRRRFLTNGQIAYWEQCVICGAGLRAVSRKDPRILKMASINVFDETLHDRISKSWWDAYDEYLKTPQWQVKSEYVLKRDNYLCQACLRRTATQAHHLHYKHAFEEPLFDLVAVCERCHKKITAMDRKRRGEL